MTSWLLSLFPRRVLQNSLYAQWRRSLSRGDRLRLDHWGATGSGHHSFAWADELSSAALAKVSA